MKVLGGMWCVGGHGTQEQQMGDLPVKTLDTHMWWSATPSSCAINF